MRHGNLRQGRRLAVLALTAMALACSTSTSSGGADGLPGVDAESDAVILAEVGDDVGQDVNVPDIAADIPDLGVSSGADADAIAPQDTGVCGTAGCPCTSNSTCDSGYCIEAEGVSVCAQSCLADCPTGYDCKTVTAAGSGATSICVPRFARLCEPCATDTDCAGTVGGGEARCIAYDTPTGRIGSFCGGQCDGKTPCPDGYFCDDIALPSGATAKQCRKADQQCPCDARAVKQALSTACSKTNGQGNCLGKTICSSDGLSPCNAPTAATETCNDIDDNCNGKTDEAGPSVCSDGNTCTYDNCVGGVCEHPVMGGLCDDKDFCTETDSCKDGVCQGTAKVCDDANPCTLDACLPASGCTSFANDVALCSDGNACTAGDACQGGTCLPGPATVCDDQNGCTTDSCDAKIGCIFNKNTLPCSDGSVCTVADTCAGGNCVAGQLLPCNDGNPCTDDSCDPVKACQFTNNAANCDDGSVCTVADLCKLGICTPGASSNCDDNNPCTTDSCDAMKGCQNTANALPCSDANQCTDGDFCGGGVCLPGPAKVCKDGNVCTDDNCDPLKGCVFVANSASCDDGSACTGADTCVGGLCKPGKSTPCDDGNPCTDDSCDKVNGCQFANNTAICSDGNACSSGDACQDGVCQPGNAVVCNDNNPCTTDSCNPKTGCAYANNVAPCDDGSLCTQGDTCKDGVCGAGKALVCNDGNPCTDDSCDKSSGCAAIANTAKCTDNNACTQNDTCANSSCVPGKPMSCDDANPCTDDSCDATQGCVTLVNANPCSDGNVCTVGDACDKGACLAGMVLTCDDGNPCTDDSCNSKTGCQHANNAVGCDDGNACTLGDQCTAGFCGPGGALNCNDANPCTDDSCSTKLGCQHANNTAVCDDGTACTVGDKCGAGKCVSGAPSSCDDGNPCTTDVCDSIVGCLHTNNTAACDDGNGCTLGDTCASGVCKPGTAPGDCDDGKSCTDDACVSTGASTHSCTHTNKAGSCLVNGVCIDPSAGYLSCNQALTCTAGAKSGVYTLDPDGPGGAAAFSAYCDMSQDGGGWTLVMNLNTDDATISTLNAGIWSASTEFGAFAQRWATDYKSLAAQSLTGTQLLLVIRNTTDAEGAAVVGWRSWNLASSKNFNSFFTVAMGDGTANATGGCNGGSSGAGHQQTAGVKSAGLAAPYDTFTGFAAEVYSNSYYGNCGSTQDGFRLSSYYRWANNSNVGLGLYMDDSDSNGYAMEAGSHMKIETYTDPQRFCSCGCGSCTAYLDGSQNGTSTRASIGNNHNSSQYTVGVSYRYEWYVR